MRRQRLLPLAVATLALTGGALLVAGASSPAAPSRSQALFRKTLLDDPRTTESVKALLRDRGGFVAPEIEFADVTRDGRADAVVLVDSGGIAGAVALYVLSTDGARADAPLRAVFRAQRLYRAAVQVSGDTLTLRTPRFSRGDDVCCPARMTERVYVWSAAAKTLVRRRMQTVAGPAS
ncbi:MAG TPA: hypothetical protein VM299_02330 [Solirubrobacteraceae bacterium]|nr:hypothetical protein [Solirubrobacteraceae bacterium]